MRERLHFVDDDSATDRLSELVRVVQSRNPFLDNRINGPSANDVDVDAIHQAAFVRLTSLAQEACVNRRGIGVVLWGEAGIGKSHLLSRLARWARQDERACCVYLHNLQAAPEHLPRSLLGIVLGILTEGRTRHFVGTTLFRLVHAALRDAVEHRLGHYSWPHLERAFGHLAEKLSSGDLPGAALIDRSVWDVVFRFFRSAYRANQGKEDGAAAALAVRWLSGQALDPEEAKALGLPPAQRSDEPVALRDNQQIKQVLSALTRFAASSNRPFLLVFDQVDNLDEEQAAALARFLEAVIDSASNLLVVTAGVKDTLVRWHQTRVIQESAWDRLAQLEITLQRVNPAQAAAIVEKRLSAFLEPFADVEVVQKRREEDALFPLGAAWRERFLDNRVEIRPRDAINWAREGWRQQQEALTQHAPLDWLEHWPNDVAPVCENRREPTREEIVAAVDHKIAEKLASVAEQLEREPHTLPSDSEHLAGLVYALLVQCRDADHKYGVRDVERVAPPRNARPTYHLSLHCREENAAADVRTGILFLMERSAIAVSGFLRRLVSDWGAFDRVIVVTAEQVGLPLGPAGREYLETLQDRGKHHFELVELPFAEVIELEAMQRVIGLAKSRDLEIEPVPGCVHTVSEQEVIETYHHQQRYLASGLMQRLLTLTGSDS